VVQNVGGNMVEHAKRVRCYVNLKTFHFYIEISASVTEISM